jgi:hypothetical protein
MIVNNINIGITHLPEAVYQSFQVGKPVITDNKNRDTEKINMITP